MTPASTAEGGRWYVIHAKPHGEAEAHRHLVRRGLEVFFPRLARRRQAGEVHRPMALFPGYLFVRLDLPRQFAAAAWSPGVRRLVGAGSTPAAVDDGVVAFLQARADEDGVLPARAAMTRGEPLEMTGGPFEGLLGILEDPPDDRGRVRVLMRLLNGHAVRIRVPVEHVKVDWVA
jgi:transcription antitermination factor NusG